VWGKKKERSRGGQKRKNRSGGGERERCNTNSTGAGRLGGEGNCFTGKKKTPRKNVTAKNGIETAWLREKKKKKT